eukprot:m.118561 g.118561  ORF g.118561 m.118561 type:complete len:501 (+) comp23131_c0_seq4:1038-2540(+)
MEVIAAMSRFSSWRLLLLVLEDWLEELTRRRLDSDIHLLLFVLLFAQPTKTQQDGEPSQPKDTRQPKNTQRQPEQQLNSGLIEVDIDGNLHLTPHENKTVFVGGTNITALRQQLEETQTETQSLRQQQAAQQQAVSDLSQQFNNLLARVAVLEGNQSVVAAKSIRSVLPQQEVGDSFSMVLTKNNLPVVSFYLLTSQSLNVLLCKDLSCAGNPSIAYLDRGGLQSSLKLTSDSKLVCAYSDEANALKIVFCADNVCSSKTVRVIDNQGLVQHISLALTAADYPVISYFMDGHLKLAICQNENCSGETVFRSLRSHGDGLATSIALAHNPVVAFSTAGPNSVELVVCSDSSCAKNTRVFSGHDVTHVSLALRSNTPVLSYTIGDAVGSLVLVACSDLLCSQRHLQSLASNCTSFSSTLTSLGFPSIAYFDTADQAIKVITCSDHTCTQPFDTFTLAKNANGNGVGGIALALTSNNHPVVAFSKWPSKRLFIGVCTDEVCEA